MRLLIVSHTPHYRANGHYVGWGPTVRELDYLSDLFTEIVHIAPLYNTPPPESSLPYHSTRVFLRPVVPAGGPGIFNKANILRAYPLYASVIRDELKKADAVHVRCPANISLLTLFLLQRVQRPLFRWVKYAGNWSPEASEAWSYTLQRRWLTRNRHRGVVTVNGQWPDQPDHVKSFFNPSLMDEELTLGQKVAADKTLALPLELLFVGALNDAKGVDRVLQICLALQQLDIPFNLSLVGDGSDRVRYEAWVAQQGLLNVFFHGWVPRQEIPRFVGQSHFILLPSRSSEGWPKVLSEAMAFGAVPIASSVSSIPQILLATKAGVSLAADDTNGMAAAMCHFVDNPQSWLEMSRAGLKAARNFTYRYYQEAVSSLFAETWDLQLVNSSEHSGLEPRETNELGAGSLPRLPL
jgi:glycosyltransferase involved in cell wall biosynthesis